MTAPPDLSALLDDLGAESAELDALVADLDEPGWRTPTPAAGWTIAHQIAHLAWTDEVAVLAIADPAGFDSAVAALAGEGERAYEYVDEIAERGVGMAPPRLLDRWRAGRTELAGALVAIRTRREDPLVRAADEPDDPWPPRG